MNHHILVKSMAKRGARDAPDEVKRLIDRLAESEQDVTIYTHTPRDPLVIIKGKVVVAWLEI